MKVLLLNTFYAEGGAARAASRLHDALLHSHIDAHLMVQKAPADSHRQVHAPQAVLERAAALCKPPLETLPLSLYPNRNKLPFFANLLPDFLLSRVRAINPDVVHLHWISAGFVRPETVPKLSKPIVWTLHDSWPFTGGCHIPLDCRRYTRSCGQCPALGSFSERDLSYWTWRRKARAWRNVPITVVTPSRWLAQCARESSLFNELRIEVIPNGLDLGRINQVDKALARQLCGLPAGKRYILFGAVSGTSDQNKGFQFLESALKELSANGFGEECELIVFGSTEPAAVPDFGMKTRYLGYLHDEVSLNLLYSAADLFVAPSMQENLPYTIMEAMVCGTPCVAFNAGGIPDLIDHKVNGYLAQPYRPDSLAEGMAWVLKEDIDAASLSRACRAKVEREFNIAGSAESYLKLYRELSGATTKVG